MASLSKEAATEVHTISILLLIYDETLTEHGDKVIFHEQRVKNNFLRQNVFELLELRAWCFPFNFIQIQACCFNTYLIV